MDEATGSVDLSGIPSSALASELSRRAWRQGRPARRVFKPCKFCTLPFGTRDMRRHLQICIQNPRRSSLRKGSEQANGQ